MDHSLQTQRLNGDLLRLADTLRTVDAFELALLTIVILERLGLLMVCLLYTSRCV